jgi:GMP synthase-like glutamine amidotransferase
VRVRDLTTGEIAEYELVGQIESDVGNGRVSVTAPVGRALVGRGVGERVDVETPRRPFSLEILGVRPLAGAQRDPDRGRMKTAATPGRFESPGSRVAVLQHEPQTGLGIFSGVLDKAGVDYEVLETGGTAPLPDIAWFDGAIVLGGSLSACDPSLLGAERWIGEAVRRGTPLLGICLGGQLLARALGGFVERGSRPEVGIVDVFLTEAAKRDSVFGNLPGRFPALAWHEDAFSLPRGAVPLAGSIAYEQQAFRFGPSAYGLQFHPEVRTDDFGRWPTVPAYRDLLERAGADWGDVMYALERVRPELDALAQQLLESWLRLVTDTSAVRERRARVAV